MVFSSAAFLFAFLPLVVGFYYLPVYRKSEKRQIRYKNTVLCVSSLLFYAWGEPVYIVLMLLSIVFNYFVGIDIEENVYNEKKKKFALALGIGYNIFALGFFKYSGFIVNSLNGAFGTEIDYSPLPLPIGISFYTFQIMSYIIDVYYGTVRAQRKIMPFMTYISMFPQLIAGPIVQYSDIEEELQERSVSVEKFAAGIIFFIRGLGKKVLFANTIGAVYTDISSGDITEASVVTSWIGIIAYTLQIYFDFSGYSDMAVGLGKMFGFNFCKNFDLPYTATSITDFWRRWHISLSSWFRDYVYIPLGGNRVSKPRHILNILIVWSLTGLWHGAAWNFVAWGAFYGILLLAEKYIFKNLIEKTPRLLRHIITLVVVMLGWVLFASPTLTDAVSYMATMFGFGDKVFIDSTAKYLLSTNAFSMIFMSLSAFGAFSNLPRTKNFRINVTVLSISYLVIFILSIIYLISETYNPFLYFRF
ncbi:MAG: MBOAT family protein [Clostridia bacterium]|nr:MBOAT family protein [Clostridia bacterium]